MRITTLVTALLSVSVAMAQPMPLPEPTSYAINNIPLPDAMNKQVCISGMKYLDGKLYFASERCPSIIVADPVTGAITSTINFSLAGNFEMEGLTSYKNKLYLVSENTVGVYEVNPADGIIRKIETSMALPPKSKDGDGMEGIAANEKNNKFYLLRERNDNMSASQLYTFSVEPGNGNSPLILKYESMIELPLESKQWRYSDISVDHENSRLLCLKSFSKGTTRQQYLEAVDIDGSGKLVDGSLKNIPVENFTQASILYKAQDYSMNLEGITIDQDGTIYIVSDNTSGKAQCDMPAREKTILLKLVKK